MIDAVLLRPLPFSHPEQLAAIWASAPQRPGNHKEVHSYLDYVDLREKNHTFAGMVAYTGSSAIFGEGDDAADVNGVSATSDLFDVLKTQPFLGRRFNPDDDKAGSARVVILGYQLWQKRYAGDAKMIGREVTLAGRVYTVIGVMPRGWRFPVQRQSVDYVTPLVPTIATGMPADYLHRGAFSDGCWAIERWREFSPGDGRSANNRRAIGAAISGCRRGPQRIRYTAA